MSKPVPGASIVTLAALTIAAGIAGAAMISPADIKVAEAILKSALNAEECELGKTRAIPTDLNKNGNELLLFEYLLSADVCKGGGNWVHTEIAVMDRHGGNNWKLVTRHIPGESEGVIDGVGSVTSVKDGVIEVKVVGKNESKERIFRYELKGNTLVSASVRRKVQASAANPFEGCPMELPATVERSLRRATPLKKEESIWTYATSFKMLELTVKAIKVGVCDASGSDGCGWASYRGVVMAMPLNNVKSYLKRQTRIDYTKEMRSDESDGTLRPVLASENDRDSVLYCDPGGV
ncbi:MAG: hypothetical protein ACREYE_28695 [Gammaproteobacteria bacterium]